MTFDVIEAGYKLQPTDIDACFGIASLPYLKEAIQYRQALVREYKRLLKPSKDVRCVAGGSAWLFGILTEKRDDLAEYLLANDIECNLIHLRNDIYSVFGGRRKPLPNMNYVEPRYLYLPLNTEVSLKDVNYICTKIMKFFSESGK